jgi:uncharacterized protein (TIGR04255 family)
MPIPESQRVVYAQNPLDEVICQLKFPPILRVDSELPAAFQEAIRQEYPLYSELRPVLQPGIPSEISKALNSLIGEKAGKNFAFASADQNWQVTMGRDFVALTCRQYKTWTQFRDRLEFALERFIQIYSPSFYSRIGLRYRDVIIRSLLGLTDLGWRDLLKPQIAGEFDSELAPEIEDVTKVILVHLTEWQSKVNIQHGTARAKENNEECYFVDTDFFTEQRTERTDAFDILNYFNGQSGRLFRWCISERLHRAMQPTEMDGEGAAEQRQDRRDSRVG